jgi:hypothetical protein
MNPNYIFEVTLFLEHVYRPFVENSCSPQGVPLLTIAICTGRIATQKWLLEKGASPATKSQVDFSLSLDCTSDLPSTDETLMMSANHIETHTPHNHVPDWLIALCRRVSVRPWSLFGTIIAKQSS